MLSRPRQARPDESLGFPSALRPSVRAAVAVVAQDELAPPHGTSDIDVDGATLHIPYRLYYDPARLRRALDDEGVDLRVATVAELMTRGPKTIGADKLAAEAAQLMEKHQIHALLVVDDEQHVVGALNIHDLLRARVV